MKAHEIAKVLNKITYNFYIIKQGISKPQQEFFFVLLVCYTLDSVCLSRSHHVTFMCQSPSFTVILMYFIYTSSNCPHRDNQQSTSIHPVIKTERPMTSDIIWSNNIAVCYNSPERRSHRDLSQTFRSRPLPGTLCDRGEKV